MAPDHWTLDALREHILAIICANEKRYADRFAAIEATVKAASIAAERALTKAETAYEKRFDSMEAIGNQQRTYLPRSEFEITHAALQKQVDTVSRCVGDRTSTGSGIKVGWSLALALVAVVVAIIALFVGGR